MRSLMFSRFDRGVRDPWPVLCGDTWEQLQALFTQGPELPDETDKLSLPAWSPAAYRPGVRRSAAAVESLDFLVLDYDEGETIAGAVERWGRWAGCYHTSWSHTSAAPKFRAILPLAEPVPGAEWDRAWEWAASYDGRRLDTKCKDPSRIYILPAFKRSCADRGVGVFGRRRWLRIPWRGIERPPVRVRRPWKPPRIEAAWQVEAAQRRALMEPRCREELGVALGGQLRAGRVGGVPCPVCGRRSVWWLVSPSRLYQARCNHLNSCGFEAHLYDLAVALGAA
jgi:hypothetical protein